MSSINVSFMKRVVKGPYEHEEMKVEFSVEDRSALDATTIDYRAFVYRTLGVELASNKTTTSSSTTKETTSKGEDNGKSNKESGKKSSEKESSEKSSKEEVNTSSEAKEKTSTKTDTQADQSQSENKSTKKSSSKKDDGIPYDCDKDEHKSTLTNFLTKLTGGKEWAKPKERSQKISREILNGQPFLAKDGSILPSFSALCKEQFGVSSDVL